jgi:hypothetical protein
MSSQLRLIDVPGMFSEGVEDVPASTARRSRGSRNRFGRVGVTAVVAALVGRRPIYDAKTA